MCKYQRYKDLQKTFGRIIMPIGRVMYFELPADDPKRAIAFYEKVFGWTITKWGAIYVTSIRLCFLI